MSDPGETGAAAPGSKGLDRSAGAAAPGPSLSRENPSPSVLSLRKSRTYVVMTVVVVVIIAVVVVLAYDLTGGFQHASKSTARPEVLVQRGATYSLPAGQFAGITVFLNTSAVLQGLFLNSFGITLYTMPISQYHTLVKWDNVTNITDYEWTSGKVADGVYYTLDVTIPVGDWVFAFVDPSSTNPTGIAFYSNVTLTST